MHIAIQGSRQPLGLTTYFISTETPSTRELAALWDNILRQGGKPDVMSALKIIEPSLVNIEFLTGELVDRNGGNTGGVLVEFGDPIVRVPLGSLGDGMRRLLVLAIALANSKGGALFIDEIDTGLHYSVLGRMWKLVAEAAAKFDIQVFATTHSADCVRGLEMFGRVTPEARNDIAILKLVQGHDRAISLTGEEAVDALELGIEVR